MLSKRIARLPVMLQLSALTALAMLLPAAHAAVHDYHHIARVFLYSAVMIGFITTMAGIASAAQKPRPTPKAQLAILLASYVWIPFLAAIPFSEALREGALLAAWWEMLASFTTTGATRFPYEWQLSDSLHLWRGLIGWMGGLFVYVTGAAILMPLGLGGAEITAGRMSAPEGAAISWRGADLSARLSHYTVLIFPVYALLTFVLAMLLLSSGAQGLEALMAAMAVLSSSGITLPSMSPVMGENLLAEVFIALFLLLLLTRQSLPGPTVIKRSRALWTNPELRMAAVLLVAAIVLVMMQRGLLSSMDSVWDFLKALWGVAFTCLSYLTTTGFVSGGWHEARPWSGLGEAPVLVLMGLVMIGGGVATACGGIKLLRVYALVHHAREELALMIEPSSVAGGGAQLRQLRRGGAWMAWISLMLYTLCLAVVMALLSLNGIEFERAVVLAVSMLSTTGPLAGHGPDAVIPLAELPIGAQAVMAGAMIIGRMEVLAILTLISLRDWRA